MLTKYGYTIAITYLPAFSCDAPIASRTLVRYDGWHCVRLALDGGPPLAVSNPVEVSRNENRNQEFSVEGAFRSDRAGAVGAVASGAQ